MSTVRVHVCLSVVMVILCSIVYEPGRGLLGQTGDEP